MNDEVIINLLKSDKVGILPTDTVYGVVGRLMSPVAVAKIYELKRRDLNKPVGTILIAHVSQLAGLVSEDMIKQASKYWPGPVSVVLSVTDGIHYAHKGFKSLPFRVPNDAVLVKLLEKTGPLATSSANIEGQPPAVTLAQAKNYFGDLPDFYIDGGDLSGRKPSRIIVLYKDDTEKEIRP